MPHYRCAYMCTDEDVQVVVSTLVALVYGKLSAFPPKYIAQNQPQFPFIAA